MFVLLTLLREVGDGGCWKMVCDGISKGMPENGSLWFAIVQ